MQLDFVCTLPVTSTVLLPAEIWPENMFLESQEEFLTLYVILELYTSAVWILNVYACLPLAEVSTFNVSCGCGLRI